MNWYRRSRHLVCYWESGRAIIHNYRTGERVAAYDDLFRLLGRLGEWTPASRLTNQVDLNPGDAAQALTWLRDKSLVEASISKPRKQPPHDSWSVWGVTAALFHFGTRDVRFVGGTLGKLDRPEHRESWRVDTAKRGDERLCRVKMPEADFAKVLTSRRTWRRFGRVAAPEETLSTVLSLTFGVQGWIDLGHSIAALRTSPSAGARQPLEAYVLVRRVEGVKPGLYHFLPAAGVLKKLKSPGDVGTAIRRYLPGQPWYASAS